MVNENIFLTLAALVCSYLVGSFPTAYLTVQKSLQIDIRNAGSGNVGARNTYEVTHKKSLGIFVMLVDAVKGIIAVEATRFFIPNNPFVLSVSVVFVTVGHCYPLWLKFNGGRGLATAAGAMLVIGWIYVAVWVLLYFIAERFVKEVHLASVVALIVTPIAMYVLPENYLLLWITKEYSIQQFIALGSTFSLVILSKHYEPVQTHFISRDKK